MSTEDVYSHSFLMREWTVVLCRKNLRTSRTFVVGSKTEKKHLKINVD